MKKNDYILISVIIFICLVLFAGFCLTHHKGRTVVIPCKGEITGTYPLKDNNKINVSYDEGGYNTITIKDGKVNVSAANCPDKVCVKHTSISLTDETIVCLPHKLIVKIID